MPPRTFLPCVTATVAAFSCVATSATADSEHPWRFDASLNLFMAGMSGDVAAKGGSAHVDATFSNIFENLEAGAAGRFTMGYERWSLSTEFSYLRLGTEVPSAAFDIEQWLVEPTLGYSIGRYTEVFAGARYNSIDGEMTLSGPVGPIVLDAQDWWDPILGANLRLPLQTGRLSLEGRFDVGGFGAGSDITWQAHPFLNWRFSSWGSVQAGYRWLGTDYETGSGAGRFVYDVVLQGPQIGLSMHF